MQNFLMGLGIGLVVGVLFAPKSGSDTRNYLSSKAGEGADYMTRQGQQLKDSASDLLERGKEAVMSQKQKLASSFQNPQPAQTFQR